MGLKPELFFGRVMHARLFPKQNKFTYGIYYLALPLSKLGDLPIPRNRFAPVSFYDRDHGACDGSDLKEWARNILNTNGLDSIDGDITLICMPRIFGYVFNPVSFWLCHDKAGTTRAILCEVHNTFGERHTYLCAHKDQRPITEQDTLTGQKLFHVSPFLKREGHYTFRFDLRANKFRTWIDFYDGEQKKQLVTSLIGTRKPMNKHTIHKAIWHYPLITIKAITLIHWQALKLICKTIKYIPRPIQKAERSSTTDNLN